MAFLVVAGLAAAPTPVIFQTGSGRFEIAALEIQPARLVTSAAEEVWRVLEAPLGLPANFTSPIFVRVVPQADWRDVTPFRVLVEPGGVVSVRIGWQDTGEARLWRRALVQGMLLRLAVSQHGVRENLTVPWWLELGTVGWWQTRAVGAQWDAVKQRSLQLAPPKLDELLHRARGGTESVELETASIWAFTFLLGEATKGAEWHRFLGAILAGEEPLAALSGSYPGRFANAVERELWWQTGWHHLRQMRTLPTLSPVESRQELEALSRFVFRRDGRDVILSFEEVAKERSSDVVQTELQRRVTGLNRLLGVLHPFYVNAGVSLLEFLAPPPKAPRRDEDRVVAFRRDWQAATELERASRAALDAWEAQGVR